MQVLVDSRSEVNAIHLSFTKQLDLPIWPIDVRAQKIDGTTLDTHGMVVTVFSIENMENRVWFFEEIFLVANASPEVVLGMPFLTLSGADVDFSGRELGWRTYTIEEAFLTTRRVELVGKKEFCSCSTQSGIWDLCSSYRMPWFHLARISWVHSTRRPPFSEASDIRLDCQGGPYKDPCQIFGLCRRFFSGLGVRAPRIQQNQRSRYWTSWRLSATTLRAYLEPRTGGIGDFEGLHWDQSS